MAKNSPKKIATNNAWTNAHYDRINLAIPRGQKEVIQEAASKEEKSVNAWIGAAINEKLNAAPALALDLSSSDGPTLAAITAAAQREGMSVNEWILDAIRDKL